MPTFTARGGRGIGVNPEGTDFPFLDPSEDIQGLLADAFVAHEVHGVTLPLHIDWLYGFDAAFDYVPSGNQTVTPTGLDDGVVAHPAVDLANLVTIRPGSIESPAAAVPTPVVDGYYPVSAHTVDLRIIDATGVIIFDSTQATTYYAINFGPRLRVHEWYTAAATCRVVQHRAFEDQEDFKVFPTEIIPVNSVLDERVSQLLPRRINSLRAADVTSNGATRLRGGYNVNLYTGVDPRPNPQLPNVTPLFQPGHSDVAVVGGRVTTRITISADPGDGDGRFKKCLEDDLPIRTINGVSPDSFGNFTLAASQCYWVRRPADGGVIYLSDNEIPVGGPSGEGSLLTASTLQIGNDCTPCCDCVDYINTYKGVTRVHKEFSAVGKSAGKIRDTYSEAIERWEGQKECRAANPSRVAMAATPSGENIFLDVAVSFCNTSDECVVPTTELNLTLSCGGGGGGAAPVPGNPNNCNTSITTGSGAQSQPHTLAGSWPNYTISWGPVDPGHSVNAKARFMFECDDLGAGCTVTACATTTIGDTSVGPTCATLALSCEGCS
jgi:hypothetical protein